MCCSMEQRQSKYLRTLGEQFSFLVNKMTEITFISKLFGILMDALMEILKNYIFWEHPKVCVNLQTDVR